MKYFKYKEFDCKCCGKNSGKQNMNPEFLQFLDLLRGKCSFPFRVTSAWRCKAFHQSLTDRGYHTIKQSAHLKGLAADIAVSDSVKRAIFVGHALELTHELDLPFRLGISGKNSFIHIDISRELRSPRLWIY